MGRMMRYCLNRKGKNEFWTNDGYRAYMEKHGKHFSDKLSDWASRKMVNANGEEHTWSVDDVRNAFTSLGYPLKKGCTWGDVAYMANMLYSDYAQYLRSDLEAVKLAYAATLDPDGYEGMIFNRFTADIMEKGVCVPWEDVM